MEKRWKLIKVGSLLVNTLVAVSATGFIMSAQASASTNETSLAPLQSYDSHYWQANSLNQVQQQIANQNKQTDMDNYVVCWGDTLTTIATAYHLSVDDLVQRYQIPNRDLIWAGYTLGQQHKVLSYSAGNKQPLIDRDQSSTTNNSAFEGGIAQANSETTSSGINPISTTVAPNYPTSFSASTNQIVSTSQSVSNHTSQQPSISVSQSVMPTDSTSQQPSISVSQSVMPANSTSQQPSISVSQSVMPTDSTSQQPSISVSQSVASTESISSQTSTSNSAINPTSPSNSQNTVDSQSISLSVANSTLISGVSSTSQADRLSTQESQSNSEYKSVETSVVDSVSASLVSSTSNSHSLSQSQLVSASDSISTANALAKSISESTSQAVSQSDSVINSASASQSIVDQSASASTSTANALAQSISESTSQAVSQSDSVINSTSASQSIVDQSASASTSTANALAQSISESTSQAVSQSDSVINSTSASQSIVDQSASASTSTANALAQSISESTSQAVSQSDSVINSTSVSQSTVDQSASASTSTANALAQSISESTSQAVSQSDSVINSTSVSQSIVDQSASASTSTANALAKSISESTSQVVSQSASVSASQSGSESEQVTIKKQDIFSIVNPTWINDADISKGRNHDRQDLGIILGKGNSIRLRQVNPNFKDKLTLRLLGDDSAIEQEASVGNDWVTITAKDNFVPFIETPLGENGAQIEYEIVSPTDQKKLPIYQFGQNQSEFFQTWQQSQAEYGLIKSKSFQMLVPIKNYDLLKQNPSFKSLDSLINYYEGIFAKYNEIAGFDNSSNLNRNSQNRYFIKADISGIGYAYYGHRWTAQHGDHIDMYLHGPEEGTWNADVAHWGTLHEIAHGYQAGFDDQGMYTREVSNNLFCIQYEYEKYGKRADQVGWLFDFGNRKAVEDAMDVAWVNGNHSYEAMDNRQKLILLTMLRQKAGNGAHTELYKGYRELASQPGFDAKRYPLPDLLNQYYSDYSQQDFTPVLENWGLKLNTDQADRNRDRGYHPVAHLIDVVPADSLKAARQLLDPNILINSNFELVQNKDIQALGLHGNLTVNLVGDQLTELQGQQLILKDGNQVVASQTITGNQVIFNQVPNGIYDVVLAGNRTDQIFTTQKYALVKEADNSLNLNFQVQARSQLLNQAIDFRGYADRTAATLTTDLSAGLVHFNVINNQPHEYINDDYIKLTVKDTQGQITYQTVLKGKTAVVGDNVFKINPGDTIEIYHRETKTRLQSSDDLINKNSSTNVLTVTQYGLENKALSTTAKEILLQKIDALGNKLEADASYGNLAGSDRIKNLKLAIQGLDAETQKTLMTKFGNLFQ